MGKDYEHNNTGNWQVSHGYHQGAAHAARSIHFARAVWHGDGV